MLPEQAVVPTVLLLGILIHAAKCMVGVGRECVLEMGRETE